MLFSFLKFDNIWCHRELLKMQFSYLIVITLLLISVITIFIPNLCFHIYIYIYICQMLVVILLVGGVKLMTSVSLIKYIKNVNSMFLTHFIVLFLALGSVMVILTMTQSKLIMRWIKYQFLLSLYCSSWNFCVECRCLVVEILMTFISLKIYSAVIYWHLYQLHFLFKYLQYPIPSVMEFRINFFASILLSFGKCVPFFCRFSLFSFLPPVNIWFF
jgi:hypothetical protein